MPRREFSRRDKLKIFARADGHCEGCGCKLWPGDAKEIDHTLPDALGGKPDIKNAKLLCHWCHKAKTKADVGRIRKADRQKATHQGLKTRKGQPMPGTKASGLRKRMDGTVEVRG